MPDRPTHYERSKNLFEASFGVDLPAVGIHSENQFKTHYPEGEYSPAEIVMELQQDFDLEYQ